MICAMIITLKSFELLKKKMEEQENRLRGSQRIKMLNAVRDETFFRGKRKRSTFYHFYNSYLSSALKAFAFKFLFFFVEYKYIYVYIEISRL